MHGARRVALFAELDPQHKARVVRVLREAGDVTGFPGDGVNGAPALHQADVGPTVHDAVDIAREGTGGRPPV